ncbi:RusA family crossover junction endodeoxyribonuclease [Melissococcus plutonius]|uniref:RusA family crossover junction endodeoxyribonuclease n=1 Tax=Melissococcus plutonius TaxID=33970 RepID=UPI003C2DA1F3
MPGQPVPQGRPRFARRGSRIQTYDPKSSVEYKKLVKEVAILNNFKHKNLIGI